MLKKPLNPTWDLETIFPGGSGSPQFAAYLEELAAGIESLKAEVEALTPLSPAGAWEETIGQIQDTMARLRQAGAFISCLTAQDVTDTKAKLLSGQVRQIGAGFGTVLTMFDERLKHFSEEQWRVFISQPQFEGLAFALNERRARAGRRLDADRENLANDLAVDGYHAWSDMYYAVVGRINIEVEVEGAKKAVSPGQAANLLAHPDRDVRRQVFAKYEQAWEDNAELLSSCLNHIAGFRLSLYRHRGWDDVLSEPLEINRMSAQTLAAMWDTIAKGKAKLGQYFKAKADLMGIDQLAWYDLDAPLTLPSSARSEAQATMAYDQGAEFIVAQFERFDPYLAKFAAAALENRWVEAEDRPGKRAGGFCTSFPQSKQSRIFMTYSGTLSNVATLAHELGHAYHQHVMDGLPQLNQRYAMNVAETASTFAELLVADAAIQHAAAPEQRLILLDDKIQRTVAFFMNIHARFLFETRFYERRKQGLVSSEELNEMMLAAQREAYLDGLSQYHPYFWASKLHFYITGTPFYNFPYTFGYLFSLGIYARAQVEGPAFTDKYRALLRDTGRMRVEDLARKHLGVDLTRPDFWQDAVNLALADVDRFLAQITAG